MPPPRQPCPRLTAVKANTCSRPNDPHEHHEHQCVNNRRHTRHTCRAPFKKPQDLACSDGSRTHTHEVQALLTCSSGALTAKEVACLADSLHLQWLLLDEQNTVLAPCVSPDLAAQLVWNPHRGSYTMPSAPSRDNGLLLHLNLDGRPHTLAIMNQSEIIK